MKAPGTADMDWDNLGFEYRDVNSHVRFTFKNGAWDEGLIVNEPYVKMHIANTALHYGQSVFEGLKAFHGKDGSIKLFRPDENAKRIRASAERILMEPPPQELFIKACKMAVHNGAWDEGLIVNEPYVKMHIANTALHYGQSVFEGLKAFHGKDGSIKLFRPDENAKRIRASAERILMEPPPQELFIKACKMAVHANIEFVPPYGSQGALYLKPLLFGSGARIGMQSSDEYTLLVMAIPVGNCFKGGFKPTTAVVIEDYDRAAPRGVGAVKVAGNYAADMMPNMLAKQAGHPFGLYLDAKTNTLVEEFSTSNFFAVTHDNKYVTPDSPAVLPSITNKSFMRLAEDEGMVVEQRPVPFDEVASFKEVGACGTALVMTTIKQIVKGGEIIRINGGSDETGPVCQALYDRVRGVQAGELEDKFGWMVAV
eukprot:g6686.t1